MTCANEAFSVLGRSLMGQRALQPNLLPTDSVFSKMPLGAIASGGQDLR